MASTKYVIDRFTGNEDFALWKIQMQSILVMESCDGAVVPAVGVDKTTAAFVTMDKKALALIRLALYNDVLRRVQDEASAELLWKKLEETYQDKSIYSKMHLLIQLFRLEMKQSETVQVYMDRFNHAVRSLTNTGFKLDDEMKVALLLARLAPDYSLIRDQILHSMQTADYKKIMEQLISRDIVTKIIKEDFSSAQSGADQSLYVRGREYDHSSCRSDKGSGSGRSSSSPRRDMSKVLCYYCKEFGHMKFDCPVLLDKKLGSDGKGKDVKIDDGKYGNVAVVANSGSDDDADLMVAVQGGAIDFGVSWILNSGCSFYMTPRREWFISYRSVPNGVSVHMGDGSVCRVVGIGAVRVRMFDGSVLVLQGVRHVPGLRKNLLSLEVFDDAGYVQSICDGSLRMSLGWRVVLKGQKVFSGLYLLDGSTVIGSGVALSMSSCVSTSGGVFVSNRVVASSGKKKVRFEVELGPVISTGQAGELTVPGDTSATAVVAQTGEQVTSSGVATMRPRRSLSRPLLRVSRAKAHLESADSGGRFLAKIFHYGSISLITEPCKSAHIAATKAAKEAGVILSYDPNLRLPLWPSAESAREGILSIWDTADIIKISEEEISFLTHGDDPYDDNVVRKLYHPNLKVLLVTEGAEGCRYYTKEFNGRVKGLKVEAVDTTGAGDAFVAGILSQLATDTTLLQDEKRPRDALYFANACGALTVTERGAIPALPTKEAVLNALLKPVA